MLSLISRENFDCNSKHQHRKNVFNKDYMQMFSNIEIICVNYVSTDYSLRYCVHMRKKILELL